MAGLFLLFSTLVADAELCPLSLCTPVMAFYAEPSAVESDDPCSKAEGGKLIPCATLEADAVVVKMKEEVLSLGSDLHLDVRGSGVEGVIEGVLDDLREKVLLERNPEIRGCDLAFFDEVEAEGGVDPLEVFQELTDPLAEFFGGDQFHILPDHHVVNLTKFLKDFIDALEDGEHLFHGVLEPSFLEVEEVLHQGHLVIEVVNERL